jgi:hypothetical protein
LQDISENGKKKFNVLRSDDKTVPSVSYIFDDTNEFEIVQKSTFLSLGHVALFGKFS